MKLLKMEGFAPKISGAKVLSLDRSKLSLKLQCSGPSYLHVFALC